MEDLVSGGGLSPSSSLHEGTQILLKARDGGVPLCLVVDDSSTVRKILVRIMTGFGFRVAEAEDGAKALDFCAQNMPDLVMLDRMMPVLDGIQFLHELRNKYRSGGPCVIMCTAEIRADQIAEGIEAGADEYVMKPFDREIVEDKLRLAGVIA